MTLTKLAKVTKEEQEFLNTIIDDLKVLNYYDDKYNEYMIEAKVSPINFIGKDNAKQYAYDLTFDKFMDNMIKALN